MAFDKLKMLGPYKTNDGTISYKGNKRFEPIKNILSIEIPIEEIENRVNQFDSDEMWMHIAKINHQINLSANLYFEELGAVFTALPLTTRMISSPGVVYGNEAINYTTDTCPITLKWFDLVREAFLVESSQIYLELALRQREINRVYSTYNSFRKEKTNATIIFDDEIVVYHKYPSFIGELKRYEGYGKAVIHIKYNNPNLFEKEFSPVALWKNLFTFRFGFISLLEFIYQFVKISWFTKGYFIGKKHYSKEIMKNKIIPPFLFK